MMDWGWLRKIGKLYAERKFTKRKGKRKATLAILLLIVNKCSSHFGFQIFFFTVFCGCVQNRKVKIRPYIESYRKYF